MRPLKAVTSMHAHGLTWLYYRTATGDFRYIAPRSGRDCGPFHTVRAMRDYIIAFGRNINWQ